MQNKIKKSIIKSNIYKGLLLNSESFKTSFIAKDCLLAALARKNFLTSSYNISTTNDTTYVQFTGFLQTNKLGRYRKNLRKRKIVLAKKDSQHLKLLNKKLLLNLFLSLKKQSKLNQNLIIEAHVLNNLICREKLSKYYNSFLRIRTSLFARSKNRFFDFLKISTLFADKKIHLRVVSEILGLIFKNLHKRQHTKFLSFIKLFFEIMMKENNMNGLRLIISGRLSGRARKSSVVIEKGILSLNSADADTVSVTRHVYTSQGTFGFQMSVNYKKI